MTTTKPQSTTEPKADDDPHRWEVEPHPWSTDFDYFITDSDADALTAIQHAAEMYLWDGNEGGERILKVRLNKDIPETPSSASISHASAAPVVDERFDVRWRRPNTPDVLECHGLTAALLVFRIRAAIRMSGGVELLSVVAKDGNAGISGPVSNHVFTCTACARQWTVDSQDALECFFVGLCYWCIRQHRLTKAEIDNHLRSLLPAAATAAPVEQSHD